MKKIFETYGIVLSQEQEKMLNTYYELLVSENEKMNLTVMNNIILQMSDYIDNNTMDILQKVIEELSLKNVETFHGRAETFGRKEEFRNQFDFVVSRAVAELPVLMEYCIPFVKKEGYFISYKGKRQEEEIEKASHAFTELGAVFRYCKKYRLREEEERYLLFIQNNELTKDKYPRKDGKPKKKPL